MKTKEKGKSVPRDIAPIIVELKLRLKAHYGDRLADIILFGSRARGDNDPDSDIDVLVVLKGSAEDLENAPSPTEIGMEFDLKYDLFVATFVIDEESYHARQTPFMMNVRREGVSID